MTKKSKISKRMTALAAQEGYQRLESAEGLGSESHVEGLVDFLCKDEDLAISGLPDSIKHEVFSLIVSQFLSTFLKTFYDTVTSQNLMGHHMELYYSKAKELRISKILEEIEEEEGSGRKPVAIDAIEDLVEKILSHKEINIGVLPDSVERQLYTKTVHVVIHCIQYILICTECDFCGYRFRGSFDAEISSGGKKKHHGKGEDQHRVKVVRADLGHHRHEVDRHVLLGVIEDATKNISGITHLLEKQVVSAVYQLAIYMMLEVLKELVFNILGDNCRLRLMPGLPGSTTAKSGATAVATSPESTPGKKRRVFTTKWVRKRLLSPERTSSENGGGGGGGGGFMGMFRSSKKESVRNGKSGEENVDDEDDDEGDKMPLWEDTDDGIDATWRTVEGVTLQHYLDSYRPPRTIPYGAKYTVRSDQVDFFTRQILHGGQYSIPGVPEAVEMLMYKQVVRTGMQQVLTAFHKAVSNMTLLGHHFELDIEEGKGFDPIKKRKPNLEAVTALAQTLLDDPNVNLSLLPDIIERQLYVNVLLISLLLVQNICDTSCVDIFGHCLEFSLRPIKNTASVRKKLVLDLVSSEVPSSEIDDKMLAAYVVHGDDRDGDGLGDSGDLYAGIMTAIYKITLYVAREALQDMAIFLLEDGYVMRIAPGTPLAKDREKDKENASPTKR